MSYDIHIEDSAGQLIEFNSPVDLRGGTYQLGGTREAWLNITYNYSPYFYEYIDPEKGIRWLYGRTVKECIPKLESAISVLGTKRAEDYWQNTAGNAGAALNDLLMMAKLCPEDAIITGD